MITKVSRIFNSDYYVMLKPLNYNPYHNHFGSSDWPLDRSRYRPSHRKIVTFNRLLHTPGNVLLKIKLA